VNDKNRLIALTDAAKIYGFSSDYLRQLVHRKRLQAQKIGGIWLTTRADVEEYIEGRQKRGVYRDDIDAN
jgi:excisionase family DNA binding protein